MSATGADAWQIEYLDGGALANLLRGVSPQTSTFRTSISENFGFLQVFGVLAEAPPATGTWFRAAGRGEVRPRGLGAPEGLTRV